MKNNNDINNNSSGGSGKPNTEKIIITDTGEMYRIDDQGRHHEGSYDSDGNWKDFSMLYNGIYVPPIDLTIPNFSPIIQPVPAYVY